jgi:5-methylcytosine-specific restriction protein A
MPRMPDPTPRRKQMHERRHQEPRYNTTAWRKYRRAFLSTNPLCVECGRIADVVDHITSVRLGGGFWDVENHQAMCHQCHNSKSGRESHTPKTYTT